MTTYMVRQFPENEINAESLWEKSFKEDEVSLEKVVYVVTTKLEIANSCAPIVMYEEPFEFYLSTSEETILKFTAQELLESCNEQECIDEPLFEDVDDMMNELSECLGGNPLSLVVEELRKSDHILACLRKF